MASERAKNHLATLKRLGQTEPVVYRPAKSGLAPCTLDVLVERVGPEAALAGKAAGFHVTALNDAELGLPTDPSFSDVGADGLDVAERRGGTLVPRQMQRFLQADDPDWTTVLVM